MSGYFTFRTSESLVSEMVNVITPRPARRHASGENVGSEQARITAAARDSYSYSYSTELDLSTYFTHDIPEHPAAEMRTRAASQLEESFDDVCTSMPGLRSDPRRGRTRGPLFPLETPML